MRPAHKLLSAGVWIVREQADFNSQKPLDIQEHPNLVLRLLPFTEANPIRSFFSFPKRGKVYLYVNETIC